MAEDTRAAFEKWVKDEMPAVSLHRDSNYWNCFVENAWEAWKACERHYRAAQTAESAQPTDHDAFIQAAITELPKCDGDKDRLYHILDQVWHAGWSAGAAQTPGETCPTCRSDDRSKRYYDAYHRMDCTDPWHSPAPAPQAKPSLGNRILHALSDNPKFINPAPAPQNGLGICHKVAGCAHEGYDKPHVKNDACWNWKEKQ